jgi:hypothetical protein
MEDDKLTGARESSAKDRLKQVEDYDVRIAIPDGQAYSAGINTGYRQCFRDFCLYGALGLAIVLFALSTCTPCYER